MVTHRSFVVGILLGAAVLAAGCGSGSSGATAGKSSATQDSSTYRAAVNALFGSIVAARGEYESGQGTPALRSAAETIQHADE
jgi:F0F1-type ATP synthase membrane subunit c/vacuolar-type H+-ATPase subunit K